MNLSKIIIVSLIISALVPHYTFAQKFKNEETGIFIQGNSSVIIETKENKSDILVDNIVTLFGGTFIKKIINEDSKIKKQVFDSAINSTIPNTFKVLNAFPNPFNPSTSIKYSLPIKSEVQITIYNILGNVVNNYHLGAQSQGWYEFNWNGTNSSNQQISSGIYIVSIKAGEFYNKQKITFIE